MKRGFTAVLIVAVGIMGLAASTGTAASPLPPKDGCLKPTMKTVRKGNRQFRSEIWFTHRLRKAGCLDRTKPRAFRPAAKRCKVRTAAANSYLANLQQRFNQRLMARLVKNEPRLLKLDAREAKLLKQRRQLRQRIRSSGPAVERRLRPKVKRVNNQLVTVRLKRARINYRMNTKSITRRGATGVWLAFFDGWAQGCTKAGRLSRYQTMMRSYMALQMAAAQFVSPPPTRKTIATWSSLPPASIMSATLSPGT